MTKLAELIQARLTGKGTLQGLVRSPRILLSALAVFLLGMMLLLGSFFTPAYVLQIGDAELGVVRSPEMVAATMEQVEGQIGEILGRDYGMALPLSYRLTLAPRDELMGYTQLTQELYGVSTAVKAAYVLSVDGAEIGVTASRAALDGALAELKERYSTRDTHEAFFANETRVTRKYVPASEVFSSQSDLLEAALAPRQTAQAAAVATVARVYETGEGSFLGGGNLSESTDSALGAMVSVERIVPQLSVCTIDRVYYPQEMESPLREVDDPNTYEGDRTVLREGKPGLLWIEADVTSLNGERLYEEILSERVLRTATETVVAVGTKERPKYVGSGKLQWPCNGNLTSPFGYRYIFGSTSFHTGIDIANSRGTPIYAADSGIVTFAAYQGTYGNMVIVDHGNGQETVYAHCASMLVSVGQGVLQGEQIATIGTSGRATGNHCHFEVRVEGTQMDPQSYLP